MTKHEFKKLAQERGIVSCRYSGNCRTMFVNASEEILSAFKALLGNYDLPFKVNFKQSQTF